MTQGCPTKFKPTQNWATIDPDNPAALCDIGCLPCSKVNDGVASNFVFEDGNRFVKPMPLAGNSRTADGFERIIRSNQLRWIPASGYVGARASCYNPATGNQKFGGKLCDCYPPPSTDPEESGTPSGQVINDDFPDGFTYYGYKLQGKSTQLFCRSSLAVARELEDLPTIFESSLFDMYPPAFVRMGPDSSCNANAMVICSCVSKDNISCGGINEGYINQDTNSRVKFNLLFVNNINLQYDLSKVQSHGKYTLLNQCLSYINATRLGGVFGNIPINSEGFPPAPNNNPNRYNADFVANSPTIFANTGVSIPEAGLSGIANWHIAKSSLSILIIAYVSRVDSTNSDLKIKLYCRALITAEIKPIIVIAGDAGLIQTGLFDDNVFPKSTKGRLVYSIGDKPFIPPTDLEVFCGSGGLMLDDGDKGILPSQGGAIGGQCCGILSKMNGVNIPAWNEFPDQIARQRISGGIVVSMNPCD